MGKIVSKALSIGKKIIKSPFGKIALGFLTGGTSNLFSGALTALKGKNFFGAVKDVAGKFFSNPGSMLSGKGLGSFGNLLQAATGKGGSSNFLADIFEMIKTGFKKKAPQTDPQVMEAATQNNQQMAAYYQAQDVRNQVMA